jgi:hypothetical protein
MKFSSLANVSKPESPKQNAQSVARAKAATERRAILLQAIEAGASYETLPEDVRAEFSFQTFKRMAQ